ncbi:unnamed protein product [Peronospora farinosa]|nr:unnamed protein product [Peronospora farinosa]
MKFKSLAKRKGWGADQLTVQLLTLIDGDLSREVESIASESSEKGHTFEDFYREVGLLLVPADYSEDLDEELWTLSAPRRISSTLLGTSARACSNVRRAAAGCPNNFVRSFTPWHKDRF